VISLIYNGIDLEFTREPVPNLPTAYTLLGEENDRFLKQVKRFKHIGAVRRLLPEEVSSAVFAPMFVTPKKNSTEFRLIYHMRCLNGFIRYRCFKMEGMPVVKDLLRQNDFITKVDIKDAYLHCGIRWTHHKFIAFMDEYGECWCFVVLPFGLTSAPRWFTKIMKECIGYFRRLGIRLTVYLDDIIIFTAVSDGNFAGAYVTAVNTHNFVVNTLRVLGWFINEEKNISEPSHVMDILGMVINSHDMTIRAPAKKLKKLINFCISRVLLYIL